MPIDPKKIKEWKDLTARSQWSNGMQRMPDVPQWASSALSAFLAEREEMLAAIRAACDRLEEVSVALSGADAAHADQVLRTTEAARLRLATFLK